MERERGGKRDGARERWKGGKREMERGGERKSTEIISEKCRTKRKGKIKAVRKGIHELLKMGKAS